MWGMRKGKEAKCFWSLVWENRYMVMPFTEREKNGEEQDFEGE